MAGWTKKVIPCWCCGGPRRLILFFFQAEDGIRDDLVTGVQTSALPIWMFVAAAGGPLCDRARIASVRLRDVDAAGPVWLRRIPGAQVPRERKPPAVRR